MRGRPRKTRRKHPTRTSRENVNLEADSPQAKEKRNAQPDSNIQSMVLSTPTRCRRRTARGANQTSTPIHSSSDGHLFNIATSPLGEKQKYSKLEMPPCCTSDSQNRHGSVNVTQPRQIRKRAAKELNCIKSICPPAKRRCDKKHNMEATSANGDTTTTQSSARSRPRFELVQGSPSGYFPARQPDESLLSSDLSIELSHHEEQRLSSSVQEDEESSDDGELPSFLMRADNKPPSITVGDFVWHKFRNYPSWPALVKRLNPKTKKASILFVDSNTFHAKKGITVALKVLKPFDFDGANELVCKAKEKYATSIQWSLELITDYRIRIACGSFSGSFIEYFAHDMSYPVRRKYSLEASERLTIISDELLEERHDDHTEESFTEQQEEVRTKRLLPDRTCAAHNRANEKLVHFIVKQRMVEKRLLSVIQGKARSRWLSSFQTANRSRVVNIYLEDDHQLDQVYQYLYKLYSTTLTTTSGLAEVKSIDYVPFVLDVLLPEAIIYAIAGVDNVSLTKAEEKYLKGRCISNRERQEFDLMIENHMKRKEQRHTKT